MSISKLGRKIFSIGFIFFLVVVLIFYCLNWLDVYLRQKKFQPEKLLIGSEVIDEKQLGLPFAIDCTDNYLIVMDRAPVLNRGSVQIFDLNNFSYITSSGYSGSAPDEVRSPYYLSVLPYDGKKFCIFDISLRRLTIYSIRDKTIKFEHTVTLKEGMPYAAIAVSDTEVVSLCYGLSTSRMALYNSDGKIKQTFGVLLPGWDKRVPISVHQNASKSYFKVKPDGKYLCVVAQYADVIDIYDNEGNLVKRIRGPLKINPIYKTGSVGDNPVMIIDEEKTKWCYLDVAVTDKEIFVLFSGDPFKTQNLGGKYIHVYGWDGKFIKAYSLDSKVVRIAVDNRGKIFGIQLYPRVSIRMFEKPE